MVKCIVFDLDNTIWNGTLDSNDNVKLKDGIIKYLKNAFEKGIILAVASKNNYEQAYKKIVELGIEKYFYKLYISWEDKFKAIKDLAKQLNILEEHILFIDDSDIELAEAKYYIPKLQILNEKNISLLNNYINDISIITEETKNRNKIYKILEKRKEKEQEMSKEEFMKYCNIKIKINLAKEEEFLRIEELLSRTNQMNLNNKILTVDELKKMSNKNEYSIFVVRMSDIFANYGIVGTTIIKENESEIEIQYLAISCKVEGRNIGKNVIEFIKKLAKEKRKNIEAKYIYNLKNEKLQSLFILSGFILDNKKYYCYKFENEGKNSKIIEDDNEEIKDKVKSILNKIGRKKYTDDYSIKDEFDSLMFIALVVSLEKEFEVEIDFANINIENFDNIQKISKFIENNIHNGSKKIETKRLILRKFEENDADEIFKNWISDPEVSKYMVWNNHKSIEETKRWLKRCIEKYKIIDSYNWGIELKENRELIGSISANKVENESNCYEIGYAIGRKYWGKGYATEALNRVVEYLMNEVGIRRILCRCAKENKASQKIICKAGFMYSGNGKFTSIDGTRTFESEEYFLVK